MLSFELLKHYDANVQFNVAENAGRKPLSPCVLNWVGAYYAN